VGVGVRIATIYTFRFERSGERDIPERRQFFWSEMWNGRLHQGWGASGMTLLNSRGALIDRDVWVPQFLAAASRFGWNDQTEQTARRNYRLLSPLTRIGDGDLLVVPNISSDDRQGIAFVRARSFNRKGKCYSWDTTSRYPLGNDYHHVINVDPSTIRHVPYDASREGKLATGLRRDIVSRGLQARVCEVKEPELKREALSLYRAARARRPGRGRSQGRPPTREQVERGWMAEDEMLRRLRRNECPGLTLLEDRRQESCGYDFLCRIRNGRDIHLEVKGFAPGGRLFFTAAEMSEAQRGKGRYWLIGLLDNAGPAKTWKAWKLVNPFPSLEGRGHIATVRQLRINSSAVPWTGDLECNRRR
jgi:hypothetical protein